MAKIFRCPACGALWRVPDDLLARRLECSECHTVFAADKAEAIYVDDRQLETRLHEVAQSRTVKTPDPEAVMTELAESIADFDARRGHKEAPTKPRGVASFMWFILGVVLLSAIGFGLLLIWHAPVIKHFPAVLPIYENVCQKLPCPGFVWHDPQHIQTQATLAPSSPETPTQITVTLTNTTTRPLHLPSLEVKYLDMAGDVIAQKLLEPGEYGLEKEAVLLPQKPIVIRLKTEHPLVPLPSAIKVTPMTDNP